MLKSVANNSCAGVMAAKTPIYLCVNCLPSVLYDICTSYFILTTHRSLSHGGVSQHPARLIGLNALVSKVVH